MKVMMKNLSIYLMTAILFGASTGFTLFSHFCLMEGNQSISTQKMDSCCAKEPITSSNTEGLNSSNCCIDNSTYLKFDFTGATQKSLEFSDIPIFILAFNHATENFSASLIDNTFHDLPPPHSGRDILLDIQVFQI